MRPVREGRRAAALRRRGGRRCCRAPPACPTRASASRSIARRLRVTAPENLIIDTPEQIALELPLANIGSRFLAIAFDTILQALAVGAIVSVALVVRFLTSF